MASTRRPVPAVGVPVELLDGRVATPANDETAAATATTTTTTTVTTTNIVTTSGRALPVALAAACLVLAFGIWQVVDRPSTTSLGSDVSLRQTLAKPTTSPTVRWETPPKFGGRGGEYSAVSGGDPAPVPSSWRPGPYR